MSSLSLKAHPIVVQKYGGSSVATPAAIVGVAKLIEKRKKEGFRLCIVVSAMGKTTDDLLKSAKEICPDPSRRELDMLLSCGERASMSLLAMALLKLGIPSISFTGSQSGIITDDVHTGAKILEVRPSRLFEELEKDKVVIVAGFQGISKKKEITTLKRGGSDTTAVALAAALKAERCEIFSDVPGVMTADPKLVPDAQLLEEIPHEQMHVLSLFGAKVLNEDAIEYAKKHNITLHSAKTGSKDKGTLVTKECHQHSSSVVAVTHLDSLTKLDLPDIDSLNSAVTELKQINAHPKLIFGNYQSGFKCIFQCQNIKEVESKLSPTCLEGFETDLSLVTVVHQTTSQCPQAALESISILNREHIKIRGISTSELQSSFLVFENQKVSAIRCLHQHFFNSKQPDSA